MTSPCIRRYRMWRSVLLVLALALACFLMTVHGYSDVATVGDVASAGSVSSETTPPPTTPTPTTVTPPPTTRTPPPTTREPTTTPPPPPPPTTTPPPPSTTAPPPTTTSPPATTAPPATTTPAPPPPTTTEPAEAGTPTVAPTTAPSTTPAPLTATPTTTTPPTTMSPTTKPTSTPTRTQNGSASGLTGDNRTVDTTKSSHPTSSGKYAIIIAVVLVVAVVLLASIYVFRRHRSKKDETAAELRRQLDQIDMEMGQGVYTKAQAPDAGLAVAVVPATNSGSGSGGRRSYPSQKPQQSPASWSSSRATAASDRDRDSLSGVWKDPEVLAARIPYEKLRFGELLSRGGFGEVFAGEYHDQRVAIKRLLPENRRRMAALEDFLKEAQLLTALEHERIVALVGVAWDSPRDLCLVLEFMPNGDLRNLLAEWRQENRPTGWADVRKLRIALHVAEALTYLHTLAPKIVHRDLKSKNVLIDDQWQAKLSDFGISRKESTHNTMTTNVGSSLWIAPEVMMGNNYDEKADIYSFGIVLTELDSLQLPYHNATSPDGRKMPDAAVLHLVTMGKLQAEFSAMSRTDIVLVGRSCLAMDPAQRPSAAELRYRLSQILGSY